MSKFTLWYPIRTKPVRLGIYNVSCVSCGQSGAWYAHWDGKKFGAFAEKPAKVEEAELQYSNGGAGPSTKSWRGLRRKP